MLINIDQKKEALFTIPEKPLCTTSDWIIDQNWNQYTSTEHATWKVLYEQMCKMLYGRVCDEFLQGLGILKISPDHIPSFDSLSDSLMKHTGWQYVAVPGLLPDEIFFEHLANRRFPAASFMRKPNELGYLEVPDVFHDVFGHAPLLTNPFMADFIQAFGLAALNAISIGKLDQLARVYWYTIETGLVQQKNGLRAFGAAISSSAKETTFALEDKSPNRIQFDLERVMRTDFYIYDLQETYFVLNDLEDFLELARFDFLPLYKKLDGTEDIGRGDTTESDLVLQYGTGAYHLKNQTPKLALVTA